MPHQRLESEFDHQSLNGLVIYLLAQLTNRGCDSAVAILPLVAGVDLPNLLLQVGMLVPRLYRGIGNVVQLGDEYVSNGVEQILLDDGELKLLCVLRYEKPPKVVSNFWVSVQVSRFFSQAFPELLATRR